MLPQWSPDDKLLYIHDKTNWWNLYQLDDDKETSLCPQAAEIGEPAWEFGGSPYSCNADGSGEMLVIHGSVGFTKYSYNAFTYLQQDLELRKYPLLDSSINIARSISLILCR